MMEAQNDKRNENVEATRKQTRLPNETVIANRLSKAEETIRKGKEQRQQALALQQKITARKNAELSEKARKKDAARKILIGAAILTKIERGEWSQDELRAMMNKFLIRPQDRALFELS